jgi:hypothetical protein
MATIKRSEVRAALKARMGQFQLQRGHLQNRLNKLTALKFVSVPVVFGEVPTERFLDELMDELHKKLGTQENLFVLD